MANVLACNAVTARGYGSYARLRLLRHTGLWGDIVQSPSEFQSKEILNGVEHGHDGDYQLPFWEQSGRLR